MKRILLAACLLLAAHINGKAQSAKPVWITIKSDNLKCWQCKEELNKYLIVENKANMESGIMQWKINLLQGEIRLQYLPDRTSAEAIRAALNNAGFDADDQKAEPDAYKGLPAPCKRAAEGGGPQKGKPCHIAPINY
jgi:periplasmic mercuric ion binding protein